MRMYRIKKKFFLKYCFFVILINLSITFAQTDDPIPEIGNAESIESLNSQVNIPKIEADNTQTTGNIGGGSDVSNQDNSIITAPAINTTGLSDDLLIKKTEIEKPMNLRDPFKSPSLRKKIEVEAAAKKTSFRNGVFTNMPSFELLNLDNLRIIGTLMGEGPRAIVVTKENLTQTFLMKEGDKIGGGKVELKAILPKGIIFVEQITNVYGQLEYLETVIPISE